MSATRRPSNPNQSVISGRALDALRARQAAHAAATTGPRLWTPGGTLDVAEADKDQLDMLDSEQEAMAGILLWHENAVEGRRKDVDEHAKDLYQKFLDIGFIVDVQPWESGDVDPVTGRVTKVPGRYEWKIEVIKRVKGNNFDPEKMSHEVTTNYLGLPGENDSAIKVDGGLVNALVGGEVEGRKHIHDAACGH